MFDVLVIGAGMIVHDQILPSLYHLQRIGKLGGIGIVATSASRLRQLTGPRFQQAFPGQYFASYPSLERADSPVNPDLWREVLAAMPPQNLVVVAAPDEAHDEMVRFALDREQHVLCVKPLVHRYDQAEAIAKLARERGLLVTVEYHKRFDRRSLEARRLYHEGRFGEFACGQARMIEPYYYRSSNFQNWFTKEKTDAFVYIGCHYVDLVYFITGLRPIEVSVRGVERAFPNGNIGYLWANGRVVFENGAILSVNAGLGYPDRGAGSNDQGLTMYCEGGNCGGLIEHNDQFRGVGHGYIDDQAGSHFRHVNPDYFRLLPWQGDGLRPVGYGYDSIEAAVRATQEVVIAGTGTVDESLAHRQKLLYQIDEQGLLATPGNSSINELVIEGARKSILGGGSAVAIHYSPRPGIAVIAPSPTGRGL
ncbi:MAG: Gfo/Idh/MocA family oxidoreductase, partial [Planctomycetes bacterium]|nr:Gfo/Idh/MocA family oxidoreductase [Planctomycetota bacterium]